jgi:hypothetical protein
MPRLTPSALLSLVFVAPALCFVLAEGQSSSTKPDAACAGCHKEIYDSYQRTPMAQASGAAIDGLLPGEFTHAASGVHYRLFLRDDRAWLSYDRPNGIRPEGRAGAHLLCRLRPERPHIPVPEGRLIEFSPDDGKARQVLAAIEGKRERCGR